ncbi:MAG: FxLYD domain-containing protein [Chloroflexi bacterium]|nr:FxLYD domain-containing protein [Chloroflexota bacterium]
MQTSSLQLVLPALLLFSSVLVACSPESQLQVLQHNITINEFTADTAQSVATVKGVVKNQGIWPVQNCIVTADFYDYKGYKIGTYTDTLQRLDPGQACDFKVELKGTDAWKVATYKVSVVSK